MTTIERKQNELAELIATHRIVKVEMQRPVIACVARKDIPAYGLVAGQHFSLVASDTHVGYAYIVTEGAQGRECTCKAFQYRHSCQDCAAVNQRVVARYFAEQIHVAAQIAPALLGESFAADLPAYIDDELSEQESGVSDSPDEIEAERAAWAAMTPDQRRMAYCAVFDVSYGDAA